MDPEVERHVERIVLPSRQTPSDLQTAQTPSKRTDSLPSKPLEEYPDEQHQYTEDEGGWRVGRHGGVLYGPVDYQLVNGEDGDSAGSGLRWERRVEGTDDVSGDMISGIPLDRERVRSGGPSGGYFGEGTSAARGVSERGIVIRGEDYPALKPGIIEVQGAPHVVSLSHSQLQLRRTENYTKDSSNNHKEIEDRESGDAAVEEKSREGEGSRERTGEDQGVGAGGPTGEWKDVHTMPTVGIESLGPPSRGSWMSRVIRAAPPPATAPESPDIQSVSVSDPVVEAPPDIQREDSRRLDLELELCVLVKASLAAQQHTLQVGVGEIDFGDVGTSADVPLTRKFNLSYREIDDVAQAVW